MSSETVVRQCERCDLTEGTVLCQECAGKEESDPVIYCTTCSELVHKGRMAKHALVCVKPDVSQANKDEAESLIAKYMREMSCLTKKIDEVEKAKENINEFTQKHDKAIRQTITVVVRQLQERGKEFIQQVALTSSEKKEQLTAIQTQLQDTRSGISQQIQTLEEIMKKNKLDAASIEAAIKDTESEVQGKLNETFLAVKLPELDTDFDIDTSSVEEAVQALQINIHPDPSAEIIAERNDIEIPALNTTEGSESPEIAVLASGPLTRNGVFWAVPRLPQEVEQKLHKLSALIRKMYIESGEWKSFEDSGTEPSVGERVYALYDADHKWYRGRVEETKSSRKGSMVRFTDYGNIQNVTHANMLPASDSLAPHCAQQGMRCCLFETLEKPLPNEARWAFGDCAGDKELNVKLNKQVTWESYDAWLVAVTVQMKDGKTLDVNNLISLKVVQDSQAKSTITCKDIRYAQVSPSSGVTQLLSSRTNTANDASPMAPPGGSMSRRLASEDQMSSLAQITAILGSGGGMRRDRKADEAEAKRQAKRERKAKRQRERKPETGGAGEQPVVERDHGGAAGDTLDTPNVIGIAMSNVLPALGLRQVCPVDSDAVSVPDDVVKESGESTEAGDCKLAVSDDASQVVNAATDGSGDTQLCPSEPKVEKSQEMTDVTTSPDDTEVVVESSADTDINSISSVALTANVTSDDTVSPLAGNTAVQIEGDVIIEPASPISSPEKDAPNVLSECNATLPDDDNISLPKTDDVSLPTTGETTLPQDGDIPVGDGSHVLTPESCVSPPCSDIAATTETERDIPLIEHDTEAVASEQPCLPAAVCESDQCEPSAVCVSEQCEPQGFCESEEQCEPGTICESQQCEPSAVCDSEQRESEQCEPTSFCDSEPCEPRAVCESEQCEPVTSTTLSSPVTDDELFEGTLEDSWEIAESSDKNCVESVITDSPCEMPSIPQTDGISDIIEDPSDECFYPCSAVSFDDDVRVHECDSREGGSSPIDNGVSCDSIKSYRASPPPPTPPAIRALAEGTGPKVQCEDTGTMLQSASDVDVPPPPVDSLMDQMTTNDGGDSSAPENDVSVKRPGRHGKHAKKVADSTENRSRQNSESTGSPKRDLQPWSSPGRPVQESAMPVGLSPNSQCTLIENVLPKAKLYHAGEFEVRVTSDLQANGQFWVEMVRDKRSEDAYQYMLAQFKETINFLPIPDSVNPSVLVLCPGEMNSWHRGRVSEVKGNKVDVCLIDCGRNVSVPIASLKTLTESFHRIPYQAVKCSIARRDYTQFSEKGQQLFKEKVRGRELLAKVITVGGIGGSFVYVDLFDCSGPEAFSIYQLIYDSIPDERPPKPVLPSTGPGPSGPGPTVPGPTGPGPTGQGPVRNGEQQETMVPYPYVNVPAGMPVGLQLPYPPVMGDSTQSDPRTKAMSGYVSALPFYSTNTVYPPQSNANYTMPPQMMPQPVPVDTSSVTMPAYMTPHDTAYNSTMQGSGDATHNHVAYVTSTSLPLDVHGSQPSSTAGSELEGDDDGWVEEKDRKPSSQQPDRQNWRQRPDHQERPYRGGGMGNNWGNRPVDNNLCYACKKPGHMKRDCPNGGRTAYLESVGGWPASRGGREQKRDGRDGRSGGGGGRGGRGGAPRSGESGRGSAPGPRPSGGARKHRSGRPPGGGRQNYAGDEGGQAVSFGSQRGGRKSSFPGESWED